MGWAERFQQLGPPAHEGVRGDPDAEQRLRQAANNVLRQDQEARSGAKGKAKLDDAYTFGRIAATNALSDIYAMGGEPMVPLNLLGWPV